MVYLNQAATSWPKPQCVLDAWAQALARMPEGQFRSGTQLRGIGPLDRCRGALGKLLGIADVDRIFFASGATDAANALIRGLPLEGRRVLATQTEHNSVLRPLMNLTDRVGEVGIVPCDAAGRVDPADLEALMGDDVAAVFVNHCSNVTGAIQDVRAMAQIAHRHGALLVADVSQSAGCVGVDADGWGVDALVFTGHKALFGPQGTGGLYVREGIRLMPWRYGGTGRDSRRLTYAEGNFEYEPGTQNAPGIEALAAGVEYVLDEGVDAIRERDRALIRKLREGLEGIPGVVVPGDPKRPGGAVLSFNISGLSPSDVAYILYDSFGIVVRAGLQCAPLIHEALGTAQAGVVRASVSSMNTPQDIEALVEAVRRIASSVEEQR